MLERGALPPIPAPGPAHALLVNSGGTPPRLGTCEMVVTVEGTEELPSGRMPEKGLNLGVPGSAGTHGARTLRCPAWVMWGLMA